MDETGRVVVVIDVGVELLGVIVVDGLVDVVGAARLVVLVVVAGVASIPDDPHAIRQTAPAMTLASSSGPLRMTRYR